MGLRIIKYNPNDYELGDILNKNRGNIIDNADAISSALSLYFQWPEHRTGNISLINGDIQTFLEASLSYDEDEIEPTLLYVTTDVTKLNELLPLSQVHGISFRFEVFRKCFEIPLSILETDDQNPCLIASPPEKMLSYHARRFPRTVLPPHNSYEAHIQSKDGILTKTRIMEIGVMGMRLECSESIDKESYLSLNDILIPAIIERRNESQYILIPRFENCSQSSTYFMFYSRIVYPHLVPRDQVNIDDYLTLYFESNYFGAFKVSEDETFRRNSIAEIANEIKSDPKCGSYDFVISQEGCLYGASSLTKAFVKDEIEYWAFHQLCAKKRPDLLEASGQLYVWRAEMMSSFPQKCNAIGWYSSESRWLNRIYTKFFRQNNNSANIFKPVKVRRLQLVPEASSDDTIPNSTINFGKLRRTIFQSKDAFGGISPHYLNASGILDAIISLDRKLDDDELASYTQLLKGQINEPTILEITYPLNETFNFEGEDVVDVDRFFMIPKESLIDFLISVEHSLAVTREKENK